MILWRKSSSFILIIFSYHTRCSSKMIYQDMEEDYPQCKVELARSCPNCRQLEVMRCHIMKRKVRRGKPQSYCSRLPSKLCVRRKCEEEEKKCYLTIKMVKEVRPEEKCKFRQKNRCQGEDAGCRTIVKRVCKPVGQSSERLQTVCGDSVFSLP